MKAADLVGHFRQQFHAEPQIFCAPGRVNLIGEHTDYNQGFVLPAAIGLFTRVAISPRSDHKLVLRSLELGGPWEFDLTNPPRQRLGTWCDYVLGVATTLKEAGWRVSGANLLVNGEVPIGAGLSSSAALEVSVALALLALSDSKPSLLELARLCQRAENNFVGAHVGIMDQFVSALGKRGHALLLDCRSLDYRLVEIPEHLKLVLANTMVKHQLSLGEYNRRRRECEEGVEVLSRLYPGMRSLRDVQPEQLRSAAKAMPPLIYNRCRHVIEENQRVLEAAELFRSADLDSAGRLMRASHCSLRDLYEVSCQELDAMVEAAEGLPGYFGGRMTGAGFGGCTVNLVEQGQVEAFSEALAERYRRKTGTLPEIHVCSPADGAGMELKMTPV
jgi:galactokinase